MNSMVALEMFNIRSQPVQFTQALHSLGSRDLRIMPKRPVQLILDFDGTLTKKDTLHIVAEAGYNRQKARALSHPLRPWQEIVDAYMVDYEAHSATYNPGKNKRTTVLSETQWLDSLANVETASSERVVEAGIFDDVTKDDMEVAAAKALKNGNVELRPGWNDLITIVNDINKSVLPTESIPGHIQLVSVNWSRWFVWSVVWKAASSITDHQGSKQIRDALVNTAVYANEIASIKAENDSSQLSVPEPKGSPMTLRTAGDKLGYLKLKAATSGDQQNMLRIYIGDSTTDLECLLTADVGICIRDCNMGSGQKELESTCARLGITVTSLDQYTERRTAVSTLEELENNAMKTPIILYYAYDYHEIVRWLTAISGGGP